MRAAGSGWSPSPSPASASKRRRYVAPRAAACGSRVSTGAGLLRGLAACDPYGVAGVAGDALRAAKELEVAREELRRATRRARLWRLCRDWDEALATHSDFELSLRSTGASRSSDIYDGRFDWAGWTARDEARFAAEADPVRRRPMELQREVVTRLAGEIALQQSWLERLPWLEEAVGASMENYVQTCGDEEGCRQGCPFAAEAREQARLFAEVVASYYRGRRCFHSVSTEVIDTGRCLAVELQLRVRREAFQAFLPGMLDDSLGERNSFHARVAAGLRGAAAVAFRGQLCAGGCPISAWGGVGSVQLSMHICSFLPRPQDALRCVRSLTEERLWQASALRNRAARLLAGAGELGEPSDLLGEEAADAASACGKGGCNAV